MASEIITDSDFYAFRTIEIVTEAVKNYADNVRSVFSVVKAYLFGSWVLGTATKYSDIDVCFFLENYFGRPKHEIITELYRIRRNYLCLGIEPHVFQASLLDSDHPFIREILEIGIEI